MTRWKLTLEYEGSEFSGWQRQENALSVQQVIEEAIKKFSGEVVTLFVAGRTDAGVHARAQVAHFDLNKDTEAAVVRDAVNYHLKPRRAAGSILPRTWQWRGQYGVLPRFGGN